MSAKFSEELYDITIIKDVKFEEELTRRFKADMNNLTNIDPSTLKSQELSL